MYSYQIDEIMHQNNYVLSRSDYLSINPNTSPQIARMLYDPFKDKFDIWTYDDYHWEFRVKQNID